MKIIHKEGKGYSDYYDYLQGILGQDDLVVYDRRDALKIEPSKRSSNAYINLWFCKEPMSEDREKKKRNYSSKKSNNGTKFIKGSLEGSISFFVLEVGYFHYYFEIERYLDEKGNVHIDPTLLSKLRIERKDRLSEEPINICPLSYYFFDESAKKCIMRKLVMKNPLLKNTYVTRFISANDIWNELYEYIASLRDKEFIDSRTNDQHIESHGFDKKTSFRHRK